ncbi:DEAD/DEAH box helicase family protein [Plantactinospora sp. S1510]|uniref:DEAD/DEAH box helicase family protein n=1 Tax=Plantactinospora alkalitolerans TaxID=2789879 RepID=A0ABS0GYV2_9ACTN|nr:DEAD/DEAH box helicase family protein [Plantactinospora alkalitolerans]MBF9131389.1 DEAD/DEAH box helicase family protein [Plantactinospora alkalitolerans]
MTFMDPTFLRDLGPRQFPRQVERLLTHLGFTDLATIDGAGDGGADVIGWHSGICWVLQCKWKLNGLIGPDAVDEVQRARELYHADEAAVVTNSAPGPTAIRRAQELAAIARPIKFWTGDILRRAYDRAPVTLEPVQLRPYQSEALTAIEASLAHHGRAMLILATGLGKTVVGGSVIAGHLRDAPGADVLVVAHTRDLVAQLERALWRFLPKHVRTRLLTGDDRPDDLGGVTFATVATALAVARIGYKPDLVMVDEAHHVGENGQFAELLDRLTAARQFGVTATPWRGDRYDLTSYFGEPTFTLGIEEGMRRGYLAKVDYRLFVDNIDWDVVRAASEHGYSLKELNARLFLPDRDEAIRDELSAVWNQTSRPRAIVFCRTIEHAERMAGILNNTLPWGSVQAVHAGLAMRERQRRLLAFRAGEIGVLTAVDILNEGVDIPDVNILCFARVTHSRRIFVQQLGRGLRLRDGKERVAVLDFVSDLRRIAATLKLRREMEADDIETLPFGRESTITFSDQRVESLMEEWIKDAASLETAYDEHRLQFPATLETGN